MKSELERAYEAASEGFSPDRVVADPDLNLRFLEECRDRGVEGGPKDLNWRLLNFRKAGKLKGRARSKRTHFPEQSSYCFASEMAARFLERRDRTTLDEILCDPTKVQEFDRLAEQIAPGFTRLQYRWAALSLRKTRRLAPEIVGQALPAQAVLSFRVDELDVSQVPRSQGLYLFFEPSQVLYVGEAENLRVRIEKHLDHSDNKGLARWIWEHGTEAIFLELHILQPETPTRVRRALEAELIRSRQPVFNIQGVTETGRVQPNASGEARRRDSADTSTHAATDHRLFSRLGSLQL